MVEETYLPGMSRSLVARRHGIGGNHVFTWRRLMRQGATPAHSGIGRSGSPDRGRVLTETIGWTDQRVDRGNARINIRPSRMSTTIIALEPTRSSAPRVRGRDLGSIRRRTDGTSRRAGLPNLGS
ncbi:transposase [Sphingomonas sp. UYP23]